MSSDVKYQEPWRVVPYVDAIHIVGVDGIRVADMSDRPIGCETPPELAERIVACVNGCRGLNPEAYRDVVEALKAARIYASCQFESLDIMDSSDVRADLDKIDAALAKAAEGNHAE